MEPALPNTPNAPTEAPKPETPVIPVYDRLVLWMFLLVFIFFAVVLLGDMLSGLFR